MHTVPLGTSHSLNLKNLTPGTPRRDSPGGGPAGKPETVRLARRTPSPSQAQPEAQLQFSVEPSRSRTGTGTVAVTVTGTPSHWPSRSRSLGLMGQAEHPGPALRVTRGDCQHAGSGTMPATVTVTVPSRLRLGWLRVGYCDGGKCRGQRKPGTSES
eukprot:1906618-Rhodomonas_salina.2